MSDFCIAKKEKKAIMSSVFFQFPDMQIQGAGSSWKVISRPGCRPQQGAQDWSLLCSGVRVVNQQ